MLMFLEFIKSPVLLCIHLPKRFIMSTQSITTTPVFAFGLLIEHVTNTKDVSFFSFAVGRCPKFFSVLSRTLHRALLASDPSADNASVRFRTFLDISQYSVFLQRVAEYFPDYVEELRQFNTADIVDYVFSIGFFPMDEQTGELLPPSQQSKYE